MKFITLIATALSILSPLDTFANGELETVPYVEVSRYLGNWYQIARNPLPFENGCVCSRQQLTLREDGKVGVYNSCNLGSAGGALSEIRGVAINDEPSSNAKFTVDFGLPNLGKYWVIGLDPEYRYAVVSEPSRRALYILSKTPELAPELYEAALGSAARQIDTSKLSPTSQQGCSYPQ